MSIGSALNAATSGLSVTSRLAELVSTNISNATTPGYVRRDAVVTSSVVGMNGGGALISGVVRDVDTLILNDRRIAESNSSNYTKIAEFYSKIETEIGVGSSSVSLSSRIATFDNALLTAISRPDSEPFLETAVTAARQLVGHINNTASAVQAARSDADAAIAADVKSLNSTLSQIEEMNNRIATGRLAGRDTTGLEELRQAKVDSISTIVPVKQVDRDNGKIALFTAAGLPLLDGRASQIGFTQSRAITADMKVSDGLLSGITLNGDPVSTSSASLLQGGSLIANFEIRDRYAPEIQSSLDQLSYELIERFSASNLDQTLQTGEPGLFTDAGNLAESSNLVGLSQRLILNAAVDPQVGGEIWRLRDGLGAASPGPSGDPALLTDLQAKLNSKQHTAFDGTQKYNISTLSTEIASKATTNRLLVESEVSFSNARALSLKEKELKGSVDSDQELQKMLMLEQAYGANAKVIQALDSMLSTLLEI